MALIVQLGIFKLGILYQLMTLDVLLLGRGWFESKFCQPLDDIHMSLHVQAAKEFESEVKQGGDSVPADPAKPEAIPSGPGQDKENVDV